MSSFAAEMRTKVLRELAELGIDNIEEESYHIKFTHKGVDFDYCTANSSFRYNGEACRGKDSLIRIVKSL